VEPEVLLGLLKSSSVLSVG